MPKIRFTTRIILVLSLLVMLQAVLLGSFALQYLAVSLEEQVGERALQMARVLSKMPAVKAGIQQRDADALQVIVDNILKDSDARFIVIGDHQTVRLTHPNPAKIGFPMLKGDSDRALYQKESYVSVATGSLGRSMRGKAPVFNEHGNVIGVISVGYMVDQVSQVIHDYQHDLIMVVLVALTLSVFAAAWVGRGFKKAIFGLEPEEIRQLYDERNATLESIREGVISINSQGQIVTLNQAAIETLELPEDKNYVGEHVDTILPKSGILTVLRSGEVQVDQEIIVNQKVLIVNRVPLRHNDKIFGVVSSFRRKDDIEAMSRRLARTKEYAENLRSQAHEYSNKLHTIAGLIQIGANERALAIIGQENKGHQALINLLVSSVSNPALSGCILGKYNRARELGLNLVLDPESQMKDIPAHITSEHLVTILGNLLNNAFEATLSQQRQQVTLAMTDLGSDLVFEIEDQGAGIPEAEIDKIFQHGFSTKAEGRGIGLALVKNMIEQLNGEITVDSELGKGTCMTVYLPKEGV